MPARARPSTLVGRIRKTRLGEMLRLYRTVRGDTLRDVGASIGISHGTLARIEYGQTFDVETLLKLARWLLSESEARP